MDNNGKMKVENDDSLPFLLMDLVRDQRVDLGGFFPTISCVENGEYEETGNKEIKEETLQRCRARSSTKMPANKADIQAKIEKTRQSARETRARKNLRYQYLEDLIAVRERAVDALRRQEKSMRAWAKAVDKGRVPADLVAYRRANMDNGSRQEFIPGNHSSGGIKEEPTKMMTKTNHFVSSSPISIVNATASISTAASTETLAISPTSSALAAMMLRSACLTHGTSPT